MDLESYHTGYLDKRRRALGSTQSVALSGAISSGADPLGALGFDHRLSPSRLEVQSVLKPSTTWLDARMV